MNAVSTALTAYTVWPKNRPSSRVHSTWYTSALKPERKSSSEATVVESDPAVVMALT